VRPPGEIPRVRLAAILLVGIYLQIGPIRSQVFHLPRDPFFKTWQMYRTFGRDICRVEFLEHRPEGQVVRNRFETLSQTWDSSPTHIKFIPNRAQVARTGRTMCKRLGPETHLTVTGECGSIYTWRPLDEIADRNLCEMTEAELQDLSPKAKKKKKQKTKNSKVSPR
jgi:hypothetical protein